MKFPLKLFFIATFISTNISSYANKISDTDSTQKTVIQYTADLKENGIDVNKIKAERLAPILIKNISIPAYRYPVINGLLNAGDYHSSVEFEKAIFGGKDACSSQKFKLKHIPSADTLQKLSAFCFYDGASKPYWMLAPKKWNIKLAYSGVDGNTVIALSPVSHDDVITQWEKAFFIPACQGCIIQEAAIFYPQLNTPENKKDYLSGVTNLTPDAQVKRIQYKSGAIGFSYTKPPSALPTHGIVRVNDIDSDDKSLDELLITMPEGKMDMVRAILNNF